jgi:hypothetical protein
VIGSMRAWGSPPSNPAAITVTRTSSPSVSSMTVPKMMLASGRGLLDELRGVVDLEDAQVGPTLDRQQDAVRAFDGRFQQGDSTASSAALMARSAPAPSRCP